MSGKGFLDDNTIQLLPMQADEVAAVAQLEAQVAAFPWTETMFSDCLKAGYSCWVAKQNGKLLAYAVLMMVIDEGHLLNIGVSELIQRQGLGSRLLDTVVATVKAAGGSSILLEVRPSNYKALPMYEHLGWTIIGRRKGYYPASVGREDALVLRRLLGEAS